MYWLTVNYICISHLSSLGRSRRPTPVHILKEKKKQGTSKRNQPPPKTYERKHERKINLAGLADALKKNKDFLMNIT